VAAATVMRGVYELPYDPNHFYTAFADSAGGTGGDSYTLAITFNKDGIIHLAKLVEVRPIFQPAKVTAMLAVVCKAYHVNLVTSDLYAGGFPEEQWKLNGITWQKSERNKSEIYHEFLPLLNSSKVRLLDDKRMFNQLIQQIDHPANAHDDCINAVAGAALLSDTAQSSMQIWAGFADNYEEFMLGAGIDPRVRIVNAGSFHSPY